MAEGVSSPQNADGLFTQGQQFDWQTFVQRANWPVVAALLIPFSIALIGMVAVSVDSHPYLWGLLIAHQCSHLRQWEFWEVDLMKQLATQVAIATTAIGFLGRIAATPCLLEHSTSNRP